jgi:S-formylglutathione hydrolase
MRRTVVTALLVAAPVLAQRPERNRPERHVELEQFTFAERTFRSEAVSADVGYGVYLPKDYDQKEQAGTKWPLAIWLHGMFEDHMRFHERGGAPVLDEAVRDGKLPPCVFVCPNGGRTSMYVNRKDKKWEDLVTVDLLAHLAKTYRVSDRRDQRAIMGVSMGGMAALRIALTQPELFGAVAVHSAAVLPEDPDDLPERMKGMVQRLGLEEVFGNPIEKEPWQKANPLCLAMRAEPDKLRGLHIYFDAGTQDRYGFANSNEKLHEVLEKRDVEHTWRLVQGGGHSWGAGFQEQTLPFSFALVGEMFRAAASRKAGLDGLMGGNGKDDGKDETGGGR